ncbi:hypothetical protein MOV61_08100 [Neorhizobium sp. BETTINA12A]|uniref:hypothetical protein n=1 Tax=Neorhizobium sp. BETTINA12A TaxID=2908924 RepID=UPI001FF60298|nr:hypothetical protein [Neorhizobium sp. BETTINA12A]MCJ9750677.1 hypothetical protein [Neorhizobium sp. BETTINA12A]
MSIPKIIALCGHPTSGKTTAAEIINEVYGHELADDGRPLRLIEGLDGRVDNAVFCMSLARRHGVDVPAVSKGAADKIDYFMVEPVFRRANWV